MLSDICDGIRSNPSCNTEVTTGCGHLYVIADYSKEKIIRIEAVLGKEGCCTRCQNSALSKAITIGLAFGVPLEEYVRELKGIQCEKPTMFPKESRILSCPDGIAKALEEVGNVLKNKRQDEASKL